MSALRKDRLLKETLGEKAGHKPAAEGLLTLAAVAAGMIAFVFFAG